MPERSACAPDDATVHTSRRILDATAEVLGRSGVGQLSLSQVAQQAGVSRPTLYRWFASKAELIEAFSHNESELLQNGIASAVAGLRGPEKLDGALRFIVEFQRSYPGVRMIDIEPGQVIARISRVLPIMRERMEHLLPGPAGAMAAATVTRVATLRFVVRSDDDYQFLSQLRHAAGIGQRSANGPVRHTARFRRGRGPSATHYRCVAICHVTDRRQLGYLGGRRVVR